MPVELDRCASVRAIGKPVRAAAAGGLGRAEGEPVPRADGAEDEGHGGGSGRAVAFDGLLR